MSAAAITSSPSTPAPLLEALFQHQHGRRPFVAGIDQLEEQDRPLLGDRQNVMFLSNVSVTPMSSPMA